MHSFSKKYLKSLRLPLGTSWLLGECMEAKGKQQLWEQKRPEVLRTLRDRAMIQSVESSNRIEGIEVARQRLKPLVLGQTKPQSRSEEEIMGYRHALELIHAKHQELDVTPKMIMQLHGLAQEGAGDAGRWKIKDNEIIEFDTKGHRNIRFTPVKAKQTPNYIEQLCISYSDEISNAHLPPLIICVLFILDFLCIHPFRDGNGRVSRLLNLLLLYQQNIHAGKYIGLERIIEENKNDYYEALKRSSEGWHESKHNPLPWINFFLSTLRLAYKELAEKVEFTDGISAGKGEIIEKIILSQAAYFTLRELQQQCPNVSFQMIKKILNDLKKKKKLVLIGRGRGAKWRVI